MAPSRSFGSQKPQKAHLLRGSGGISAEVSDLRKDIEVAFLALEAEIDGVTPPAVPQALELERWPDWLYVNPSQYVLNAHQDQDPTRARIMLPDYTIRTLPFPSTFNPSTVGPGGLDTGTLTPNTFLYTYAVPTTPTSETLEIRGSLSELHPTVSANARFLGALRINALGEFDPIIQDAYSFQYPGAKTVLDLGPAECIGEPSPVSVDLSAFVPKTAGSVYMRAHLSAKAGGTGMCVFFIDGWTTLQRDYIPARETGYTQEYSEFPIPTNPKKIWRQFEANGTGLDVFKLLVLGWYDSRLI